ncbi:MAG: Flp pilus assembly complex ATPase component TadA [Phycisphaerales bacterium]|nr:Flp pilus assembly complex ATPase component TadA [Phycisphaerales bacterium]
MLTLAAQAEPLVLVSFIKPVLFLVVLVIYLRFISSVLESDLRRALFNVAGWNSAFIGSAAVAMVVGLVIPIFWIGFPAMILVLLAPLLIYWKFRNDNVGDEHKFHLSTDSLAARSEQRRLRKTQREATAVFLAPDGSELTVPDEEDPLRPIHISAEDLLLPAIEARGTRIELAATPKGGTAVQVVDAVRYRRDPLPTETASRIIDYCKQMANLDVDDRRKLQRGRFKVRTSNGTTTLDLTTSGGNQGLIMRLDLDRDEQFDRQYNDLGFVKPQLETLSKYQSDAGRHGVILAVSAPGQGLTSTLYGLLTGQDAYVTNIKTLERDVQRHIEGIDHVEWDPNKPELDFPTQVRSILRRGPDIVMISDLQDPATGDVLASPGHDGPLILVGVQSRDGVAGAVTEWFRSVGDLKKAASPLNCVVSSRIMRKLCPECRQEFTPSAEQLKRLGITGDSKTNLFRGSGRIQVKNKIEECPVCRGTGYFGTIGVFEIMEIDRDARRMLATGDLRAAYQHSRRALKMLTMQEAALMHVREGISSLEEVARLFSADKKAAARPAAKTVPAKT